MYAQRDTLIDVGHVWMRCTYDVWGNEDDGYAVNDVYRSCRETVAHLDDDQAMENALREVFGIDCDVRLDWTDETWAELTCAVTGAPLGRLVRQ